MSKTVLFQIIQFIMNFCFTQFNSKTVRSQTILFSVITQFISIWPLDKTLSNATTPGQSEFRSDGSERALRIPHISSITEASPSNSLMSHPGHTLEESYPSAEMQSVYSIVPADWAKNISLKEDEIHWKSRSRPPA